MSERHDEDEVIEDFYNGEAEPPEVDDIEEDVEVTSLGAGGKLEFIYRPGEINDLANSVVEVLELARQRDPQNFGVYRRGGQVVHVHRAADGGAEVADLTKDALKSLLVQYAQPMTVDTAERPSMPRGWPVDLIAVISARLATSAPVIDVMVSHPIVSDDLTLHAGGYSPATRIYVDARVDLAEEIDAHAAEFTSPQAALAYIDDVYADVQWAAPADRLRAYTVPMSLLCRGRLQGEAGPPGVYATSPDADTGKTTLITALAAGVGCTIASTGWTSSGNDNSELRKRIEGEIKDQEPTLFLDQVPATFRLDLDPFTHLITNDLAKFRDLGFLRNLKGSGTILPLATGLNLSAPGEAKSRWVRVELILKRGRDGLAIKPEFKVENLVKHCRKEAPRLIGAFLVIMRDAAAARSNVGLPGRFPAWARMCALPLALASGDFGFLDAWLDREDSSPMVGKAGDAIEAILSLMRSSTADLWLDAGDGRAPGMMPLTMSELAKQAPGLTKELDPSCGDRGTSTARGRALQVALTKLVKVVCDGWQLRVEKANLGERTNYRDRSVVWAEPISDDTRQELNDMRVKATGERPPERGENVTNLNIRPGRRPRPATMPGQKKE